MDVVCAMTSNRLAVLVCLIAIAFVFAMDATAAPRKSYDEIKAERIAKQRAKRKAIEAKFKRCMEVQKCQERCR